MATYSIVRFYQRPSMVNEIVDTGLTLDEAQEHCASPETSSRTCTSAEGLVRARQFGPWFDGYREE